MPLSPFLDVDTPITFKDQPGVQSAVLYTHIPLCNLECFQCHNKAGFDPSTQFASYEKLLDKLNKLKLLGVELIIVSGGEPLLEKRLKEGLKFIKQLGFSVRVDTNGTLPETIEQLIREKVVDGFALDVKIPIKSVYFDDEIERFNEILYSKKEKNEKKIKLYVQKIKKSIEKIKKLAIANDFQYTILRTVKYPLLKEEDIEEIKRFVRETGIPFQLNPFYPVEA
ncbi:radical SAM protein [Desulfurobacterium atlanticum]|uniref:Pyruvate formate lyase activating enzyme n=1 Tax=Desulfurobacterium atlanticum TaxID=240169 RepID=A0A239A9F5_9BACT|nr:radical SAM protein [Desulfurobacterium atlanticum]SNR92139.1 pyruvate formate lyase activating enzyme [Desulfurobacterium atlanticum]